MPKASKKSAEQLEKGAKLKTEHAVERVDDWMSKIARYARSRKYQLTEPQKAKIVQHLADNVEKLQAAFQSRSEVKETFKL